MKPIENTLQKNLLQPCLITKINYKDFTVEFKTLFVD